MKHNKNFLNRTERFFAGKGFYIVLFLCAVVIAISTWVLLSPPASTSGGDTVDAGTNITPNDDSADVSPIISDAESNVSEDSEEVGMWVTPSPSPEVTQAPVVTDSAVTETDEPEPLVFSWPVSGNIVTAYSPDDLLYDATMKDWRTHNGLDIAAEMGTQVLAVAEGTVAEVYEHDMYGTTVVIDHGDGLKSIYANLAAVPAVSVGATVLRGDVIGSVGDTAIAEISQEAHLHFAMSLNDDPADPLDYLPS